MTFCETRVVGRSPAVWIVGNSSASIPFTWVAKRPQRRWSVSAPWSSRSTFSEAGRRPDEIREQAGGDGRRAVGLDLAGHPVGDPDLEVRRGELEAGVLRAQEDVREHGQGAPAGDGPRHHREAASEVLLHDREFHVGCLQQAVWAGMARAASSTGSRCDGEGQLASRLAGGMISLSSHPVITVIMPWIRWTATLDRAVGAGGRPSVGPWTRQARPGDATRVRGWTFVVPARGPVHTPLRDGQFVPDAIPESRDRRPRRGAVVPRVVPEIVPNRWRAPARAERRNARATVGIGTAGRGERGRWNGTGSGAVSGDAATRCRSAPGRRRPRAASRRSPASRG